MLGLPGGGEGEARSSSGKRGFAETIDLKLKLEPAGEEAPATEDRAGVAAAAATAAEEEHEKAVVDACVGKTKRSPSQSSVVTIAALLDPAKKPRTPKYVAAEKQLEILAVAHALRGNGMSSPALSMPTTSHGCCRVDRRT
ncbi:hypothetical protein ZWY2020_042281 [Hordeum vulgare]|nr:hypothetical protein ZWY2020_042281 [Hordeum vulgare]